MRHYVIEEELREARNDNRRLSQDFDDAIKEVEGLRAELDVFCDHLTEAEAILNDLANDYPVSWNAAALNFCTLCSVMALPCDGKGSFPESHDESCPWRRAVEWKAKLTGDDNRVA